MLSIDALRRFGANTQEGLGIHHRLRYSEKHIKMVIFRMASWNSLASILESCGFIPEIKFD